MSASPIWLNSSRPVWNELSTTRPKGLRKHWLPVLCALVFISLTSTSFMGGTNTGLAVQAVWKFLFGTQHIQTAWRVNFIGRKVGHFFGYGIVSLIFRNAWYRTAQAFSLVLKSWLSPFAAILSIVSTFTVAALDEYHQMFLPGRVGSLHDALLDTSGALFLNLVFWAIVLCKREKTKETLSS